MKAKVISVVTAIGDPTNGAEETISFEQPYVASVAVKGVSDFIFHRWNVDSVDAKSKAAKGSKAKKQDDIESYVYRDKDENLAIPTEYFRMALIGAAKFKQDPRSPRKSAQDLFKAGIANLTDLRSLGKKEWDYLDRRRVTVQRNGITRVRPAMLAGWHVDFEFQVLLPEYISPGLLNEMVQSAGRLIGVGDFRPTFGRFQVVGFESK
jgi:hypothetical protein